MGEAGHREWKLRWPTVVLDGHHHLGCNCQLYWCRSIEEKRCLGRTSRKEERIVDLVECCLNDGARQLERVLILVA